MILLQTKVLSVDSNGETCVRIENMEVLKSEEVQKLVSFFFEIGTLRKVLRSHRQTLLTNDLSDNVSSHSFRTAFIGYFLAKLVGADENKVVKMCLLHDIEESRAGDQNWVHKKLVKVFEEEIRKGQLQALPKAGELVSLSKEYHERKTREANVAKDADLLEEILTLREHSLAGNEEAKRWLGHIEHEKRMFTKVAKTIAKEAKKQRLSSWWDNIWTSKRRV